MDDIDFGSLVLGDIALDAPEPERKAVRRRAKPTWAVQRAQGPDCRVIRRSADSETRLSLSVSTDTFLVVDADGSKAALTEELLAGFFRGSETMRLGAVWCEELRNTKENRLGLICLLDLRWLARRVEPYAGCTAQELLEARSLALSSGLVVFSEDLEADREGHNNLVYAVSLALRYPEAVMAIRDAFACEGARPKQSLVKAVPDLVRAFGCDAMVRFITSIPAESELNSLPVRELLNVPASPCICFGSGFGIARAAYVPHSWLDADDSEAIDAGFTFDRWYEYAIMQSAREGHAMDLKEWFNAWASCIELQAYLYGEVKDPYPKGLKSTQRILHDEASRKSECQKRLKMAEALEPMRRYDHRSGDYEIAAPRSYGELLDIKDALELDRCLFSEPILQGKASAFILRKVDGGVLDSCLVMMRGSAPKLRLGAIYGRRESACPMPAREWLSEWCKGFGFEFDAAS